MATEVSRKTPSAVPAGPDEGVADIAGQKWRVEKFERAPHGMTAKLIGFHVKDEHGTVVAEQFPQSWRAWVDIRRARVIAAAPALLRVLAAMNHMGGDERGGYCICACNDGSAPDEKHATICVEARAALAQARGAA